jgi:GntR family negative regulator for fad regulon and positive regulator of fabA
MKLTGMTTYQLIDHGDNMPEFTEWKPVPKPAEIAENRLIHAILEGRFPIHSPLPGERQLADLLGVTRPTLREALQRLARDGWVDIQQGKSTRVRDYWQEGNLGVLAALARYPEQLPLDFVPNLLQVRSLLAPAYTRLAVEHRPQSVASFCEQEANLAETAAAFAAYDWQLHSLLTHLSGNPVFTLILNGFRELYPLMGARYFALPPARRYSRHYYQTLGQHAANHETEAAEALTKQVMMSSIDFWQKAYSSTSSPAEGQALL